MSSSDRLQKAGPYYASVVLLKKITESFEGKPTMIKMNQVTLDMLRFSIKGGWGEKAINGAPLELDNSLETGVVTVTGSVLRKWR